MNMIYIVVCKYGLFVVIIAIRVSCRGEEGGYPPPSSNPPPPFNYDWVSIAEYWNNSWPFFSNIFWLLFSFPPSTSKSCMTPWPYMLGVSSGSLIPNILLPPVSQLQVTPSSPNPGYSVPCSSPANSSYTHWIFSNISRFLLRAQTQITPRLPMASHSNEYHFY